MRHVYQDTPDYYNTSLQDRYWDEVDADATVTAAVGYGGGAAWTGSSASAYRLVYVNHGAGQSQAAVGIKFRYSGFTSPASAEVILGITDANGDMQASVVLNTDGTLSAYRGDASGVELIAGVGVPIVDTWYDLGLIVDINGANGSIEIDLNQSGDLTTGGVYVRVDGVNTQAQATSDWLGIYVGSTPTTRSCHLYARNGVDGMPTLVPGWVVTVKFPASDGGYTGWSANTGDRHNAVDETPADDDTTYVVSDGELATVSFIMATMTGVLGVLAIDSVGTAINETGFTNTYRPLMVHAANDPTQRTIHLSDWRSLSDSVWRGVHQPYGVNPITGVAWKPADVMTSGRTEWGAQAAA